MLCNYTGGSLANTIESLAILSQQIDESHYDLANLLTQQMVTVVNPWIVTNNAWFEQLARQVGRIAEIINLDETQSNKMMHTLQMHNPNWT